MAGNTIQEEFTLKMKKFLAGLTAGLLSATALVAPAAISAQSIAGHAELGKNP